MQKKKVLIVTYYWPPSGGAGVQRWLKLSKYLSRDVDVYVYTPENPDFSIQDEELIKKIENENIKVIKRPIFEPYFIYSAFLKKENKKNVNTPSAMGNSKDSGYLKKLALWARGNIFVPDPRMFWIRPSVKFLKDFIKKEEITNIISTGPPHSMHCIALGLKDFYGKELNWVADFRDPWTNIDFYDQLKVSKAAHKKNSKLEQRVITTCDTLVTVSPSWAKDFEKLSGRDVLTITNGFDEDDFKFPISDVQNSAFVMTYIGSMNADRNPPGLWTAIKELVTERPELGQCLKIQLIGNISQEVKESIAALNLSKYIESTEYIPHSKALLKLSKSDVSILILNNTPNVSGIIPGKLFEYIGAKVKILCIGNKEGDSAHIIESNGLGYTADFNDVAELKQNILTLYENKDDGLVQSNHISQFSVEYLAKKINKLLV